MAVTIVHSLNGIREPAIPVLLTYSRLHKTQASLNIFESNFYCIYDNGKWILHEMKRTDYDNFVIVKTEKCTLKVFTHREQILLGEQFCLILKSIEVYETEKSNSKPWWRERWSVLHVTRNVSVTHF